MDQKEQDVQKILETINSELEAKGISLSYQYNENAECMKNMLLKKLKFNPDYLNKLINICVSRGYIKKQKLFNDIIQIRLTEKGQQQVLNKNPVGSNNINIEQVNVYGNSQIGNNNNQNISGNHSLDINKNNNSGWLSTLLGTLLCGGISGGAGAIVAKILDMIFQGTTN